MIRSIVKFIKENKFKLMALKLLSFLILIAATHKGDAWVKSKTVLITDGRGLCSGEQIKAPSGYEYILSAAHCLNLRDSDGNFTVVNESGAAVKRRLIAEDPKSDLILIEPILGVEGLTIASHINAQEHVRTFTHGRGFKTYKTEGNIIDYRISTVQMEEELCEKPFPKYKKFTVNGFFGPQEVCVMATKASVTTAMTVPGSSGGMVVNDSGELVGVVSAGDGIFGYLVDLEDIKAFLNGY